MDNLVLVAKNLFSGVWNMLLQTDFPGTDISLAAFTLAIVVMTGAIKIFGYLTGFRAGYGYGAAADSAAKAHAAYKKDRMSRDRADQFFDY